MSRSKLGKFIDKYKIKQVDIAKIDCISPSIKNANKIVQALKKLTGKNINQSDVTIFLCTNYITENSAFFVALNYFNATVVKKYKERKSMIYCTSIIIQVYI
ncbi:hypothetical protein [Bacillus tropicus]|uniref:hypothetical protein n=1 Tax=Bacillus cereus group TaxID=86661 RepID=UPI0003F7E89A